MFAHVEAYAGDPILTLVETFNKDTRNPKVNLGIGLYYDEEGRIPLLPSVQKAEAARVASAGARSYQPMEGAANYRTAVQALLWGAGHEAVTAGRIATIQTIGGSGALKIGGDLLKRYFPDSEVWVSAPTWDNHRAMFEGAGFTVHDYPYYDAATGGVKFDEMIACFKALPAKTIVLLHPCCHNPTGVDLNLDDWKNVLEVVKAKGHVPFLDMAYQGFGDGIAEDAFAVRLFAESGLEFFVSSSFSKSFSLYGERVGALSIVTASKDESTRVLSQVKRVIRTTYSNPPTHGATIVATVLNSAELRQMWETELAEMRERIHGMRKQMVSLLAEYGANRDFSFVGRQVGMFSYSGLTVEQVARLKNDFGIYALDTGRIAVAALNQSNIHVVTKAIVEVL